MRHLSGYSAYEAGSERGMSCHFQKTRSPMRMVKFSHFLTEATECSKVLPACCSLVADFSEQSINELIAAPFRHRSFAWTFVIFWYPLANMQHSPGFLKMVEAVRPRIREVTLEQARERLQRNPRAVLVDVREDSEWNDGHAAEAVHLGKGVFERDLEKAVPDPATEIILYCGGGYRSALAADAAQSMGYKNVFSLIGGYKAMVAADWPMQ
jgi:rhodanese-related sulfurtransferase